MWTITIHSWFPRPVRDNIMFILNIQLTVFPSFSLAPNSFRLYIHPYTHTRGATNKEQGVNGNISSCLFDVDENVFHHNTFFLLFIPAFFTFCRSLLVYSANLCICIPSFFTFPSLTTAVVVCMNDVHSKELRKWILWQRNRFSVKKIWKSSSWENNSSIHCQWLLKFWLYFIRKI